MRLRISVRGRVRPSVGPSIPCYFRMTNMAVFEGRKSTNDFSNNDTVRDDEVVASYVSPRYLFSSNSEDDWSLVVSQMGRGETGVAGEKGGRKEWGYRGYRSSSKHGLKPNFD